MIGLDLFSGIGGVSLALEPWVRPIAYCELDRYAQAVLLSRQLDGRLRRAPIWDDVRTLKGCFLNSGFNIDIIYGGFPCQDISVAGTRKGLAGKRSGLVSEIFRLTRELSPTFIFLENVPGIRTRGGEMVGKTLASLGYDCRWLVISAAEVGACHERKRWFLLAHNNRTRGRVQPRRRRGKTREKETDFIDASQDAPNTHSERLQGRRRKKSQFVRPAQYGRWISQPTVCGRVNGVPNRVDRVKSLGNAVVPLQAQEAFKRLIGLADTGFADAEEGEK